MLNFICRERKHLADYSLSRLSLWLSPSRLSDYPPLVSLWLSPLSSLSDYPPSRLSLIIPPLVSLWLPSLSSLCLSPLSSLSLIILSFLFRWLSPLSSLCDYPPLSLSLFLWLSPLSSLSLSLIIPPLLSLWLFPLSSFSLWLSPCRLSLIIPPLPPLSLIIPPLLSLIIPPQLSPLIYSPSPTPPVLYSRLPSSSASQVSFLVACCVCDYLCRKGRPLEWREMLLFLIYNIRVMFVFLSIVDRTYYAVSLVELCTLYLPAGQVWVSSVVVFLWPIRVL